MRFVLISVVITLSLVPVSWNHYTEYFEIFEELEPNTFVGKLTTRTNFTYRFSDSNQENFKIEPTTGRIYTKRKIDRESLTTPEFVLLVLSSEPVYPTEVKIRILDANDNAPVFPKYVFQLAIPESDSIGSLYPLNGAIDLDIGKNSELTYRIIKGNSDRKFSLEVVDNPQGSASFLQLNVTGSLDRETVSSYILHLSAIDHGQKPLSGSCILNITVLDANDEHPLLNPTSFKASIYENATVGSTVAVLNSTDRDLGENGRISYFIHVDNKGQSHLYFQIHRELGTLQTSRKLDRELQSSFAITVIAKDNGVPPLESRAVVHLNILDVNDNKPRSTSVFQNPIKVKEDSKLRHIVQFLSFEDADSADMNKQLSVKISQGNELSVFRLNTFAGKRGKTLIAFLLVNKELDREKQDRYNLSLIVSDNGAPRLFTVLHLLIDVQDVNDCVPKFTANAHSATITENIPRGSYVGKVKAVDCDLGLNGKVKYEIVAGNERNWFSISADTGLITTSTKMLDRESMDKANIDLKLSAHDLGSPRKKTDILFKVLIKDENDNAPRFNQSRYVTRISETAVPGIVLLTVLSRDFDAGANGAVTYQLAHESMRFRQTVKVGVVSGEVRLMKTLDYELVQKVEFYVSACDNGEPKLCSKSAVEVQVIDLNDNAPVFISDRYYAVLDTAQPCGHAVQVKAVDPDSGKFGAIFYTILSGNDNGAFRQNATSGEILCQKAPQPGQRYHLIVTATDGGKRLSPKNSEVFVYYTQTVSHLVFLRDHYSFHITENSAVGSNIGRVQIFLELNQVIEVEYLITDGDPGHYINITKQGDILVAKVIDREVVQSLNLTVLAKSNDSVPILGRTSVLIFVDDENDNAPLVNVDSSIFHIAEDASVEAVIGTIQAADFDYGQNSKLSFKLLSGHFGYFSINQEAGVLSLAHLLTNVKQSKFELVVQVSDHGMPSKHTEVSVTIQVVDKNDHRPVFSAKEHVVWVNSDILVNSHILKLNVTDLDRDVNGQYTLNILKGNVDNLFGLFPDGTLYVKASMGLIHAKALYNLSIEVHDHGEPMLKSQTVVFVHVNHSTENVKIFKQKFYSFNLMENVKKGTFIGNVTLHTVIREWRIKFANDQPWLSLTQRGSLKTKGDIDREAIILHRGTGKLAVRLEAYYLSDSSSRDFCTVHVNIQDENDNGPVFASTKFITDIMENAKIGTVILQLSAIDPDAQENAQFLFEMNGDLLVKRNFLLDDRTGVITVKGKIDHEVRLTYNITVNVLDRKNRTLKSSAHCIITVLDENDNAPKFLNNPKKVSISEDKKIGSLVAAMNATDEDSGKNAELEYAIKEGNSLMHFRINPSHGVLTISKRLDYETVKNYRLIISVSDKGVPPKATTSTIDITVTDTNDNAPIFENDPVSFTVTENVNANTIIGQCKASDKDTGVNGDIKFSLVKSDGITDEFSITSDTCRVSMNFSPDREKQEIYNISIKAEDQGELLKDRQVTFKKFLVLVKDQNDNSPRFISHNAVAVQGNVKVGSVITTVRADDYDSGKNGEVKYQISSSYKQLFQIGSTDGRVIVKSSLNIVPNVFFNISITATDQGTVPLSTTTNLIVFKYGLLTSDIKFEKQQYSASLNENNLPGSFVISVRATYTIGNPKIKYFIVEGNIGRIFNINEDTGVVSTLRALDYESDSHLYTLKLYAVDINGPQPRTSGCSLTIKLVNLNDNAPRFLKGSDLAYVYENATLGSRVFKATAVDVDNGGVIYGTPSGGMFRMQVNGNLLVNGVLDREKIGSYTLIITAKSKGTSSLSSTLKLTINVLDCNDNSPTFDKQFYSFSVSENEPIGHRVGAVMATDEDIGRYGQVMYSMGRAASSIFSIDKATGALYLKQKLDHEEEEHYVLQVIATDYGEPRMFATVSVYINVRDVNDNSPKFDKDVFHGNVVENADIPSIVAVAAASDKDSGANGLVKYSLISTNAAGLFEILANGSVLVTRPLDREAKDVYTMRVKAEDQAEPKSSRRSATATVIISVKDENDNSPVFASSILQALVPEGLAVGGAAYVVKATDTDAGMNGIIDYFTVSSDSRGVFRLEKNGALILTKSLDYETRTVYNLVIEARDRGIPSRYSHVNLTVNIQDANDHYPIVKNDQLVFYIPENVTLGHTITTIIATDLDSGSNARLSYSIYSGNARSAFGIDSETGRIYTSALLDRETKENYTMIVTVSDSGTPSKKSPVTLTVHLIDVNDCYPTFSFQNYLASVPENRDGPLELLHVGATDCDAGKNGQLTYRFINAVPLDLFTINSKTGEISLLKHLDREEKAVYTFLVEASDGGMPSLSSKVTATLTVEDKNDNSPILAIENRTVHVKELSRNGVLVTKVTGSDLDIGHNAEVFFALDIDYGRFRIDGTTGNIYTTGGLDREAQESYTLTVRATDKGVPPRESVISLQIVVDDVNDNGPKFDRKRYAVKIPLNAPRGTFVMRMETKDADTLLFSDVVYSIVSGNQTVVQIDRKSGTLVTTSVLPPNTRVQIEVKAEDAQRKDLTDKTSVVITTDTGFPVFAHSAQIISVPETIAVGTTLLKVNATTQQDGPAGQLRYFIASHSDVTYSRTARSSRKFKVREASGELFVSSGLDYEEAVRYSLWIEARDSQNPPLSAFVRVLVSLINRNDTAPACRGITTRITVMENKAAPYIVTKVNCKDTDNGGSTKRIRYAVEKLGGTSWSHFSVDAISGEVRTKDSLNREKKAQHSLSIIAFMVDMINLRTLVFLTINVGDDNDNPPITSGPKEVSVKEDININTTIAYIRATDADVGLNTKLSFSLSSSFFAVDSESGRVYLTARLDREREAKHVLMVKVYDGLFRVTHQLRVTVTDMNDSPPVFTNPLYLLNCTESTAVGTPIFRFSYTDKDLGHNTASRFLMNTTAVLHLFSIDSKSGELALNKKVKYQKSSNGKDNSQNRYQFKVRVQNILPPYLEGMATVIMQILDSNNNPPSFLNSSYHAYISASSSKGYQVLSVKAVDKLDTGNNAQVRYRLLKGNGSSLFDVTADGRVLVRSNLKGGVDKMWMISVVAEDLGIPVQSSTASVYITIEPANVHRPKFEASEVRKTVSENYSPWLEILKVKATDLDAGVSGTVIYSIKGGNRTLFKIGEKNGSLVLAKALDYEQETRHQLLIDAKDGGKHLSLSSQMKVIILVSDVNDNPPLFVSASGRGMIRENAPAGTTVMTIRAIDRDSTGSSILQYSLVGKNEFFSIGKRSGVLTSKSSFDYEKRSQYVVPVSVTDNGTPSLVSMKDFQIDIIGQNEYPPKFSRKSYTFTIYDNARVGAVIGYVLASDKDSGPDGLVSYSLISAEPAQVVDIQKLTGQISVKKRLSVGTITLQILTKNANELTILPNNTDLANVTIKVLDGNDPPIFDREVYYINVSEASSPPLNILQVSANDPDGKGISVLTYEIVRGPQSDKFLIDPRDGWIILKEWLDREKEAVISLVVTVTDNGNPPSSANATVLISIQDVNDSPAKLVNCSGSVYENASVGSVVLSLNTVDADLMENRASVTFVIVSGSPPFSVNGTSNTLYVSGNLDRESKDSYTIRMKVREHATPPLESVGTCFIKILDVSDVTPQGRNISIVYNGIGTNFPGGLLGDLSPTDPDLADKYRCDLAKPSILFHFQNGSCHLEGVPWNTPSTVKLNYKSYGPDADGLPSFARLKYNGLRILTVNSSVIVRLVGVSRLSFLEERYTAFIDVLNTASSSQLLVVSIEEAQINQTHLLFATRDLMSHSNILQLLKQMTNLIQKFTHAQAVEIDANVCKTKPPCQNRGVCRHSISFSGSRSLLESPSVIFHSLNYKDDFDCTCKPGFTGNQCESLIQNCEGRPCQNSGTCVEIGKSFVCQCLPTYTGRLCEVDINECLASPCRNAGKCVNTIGGFVCECGKSHFGNLCELERTQCNPNPCLRSGECVNVGTDKFKCKCTFGASGNICQYEGLTFTSVSYLSFWLKSKDQINITLELSTVVRNGLLAYSYSVAGSSSLARFIALEIVNGYVRVSCRLTNTLVRVTSQSSLKMDGTKELVTAVIKSQVLVLVVNGEITSSPTNDASTKLDFGDSIIFIGGVQAVSNITSHQAPLSSTDFVGCLHNIFINNVRNNVSHSIDNRGVQRGCKRFPHCASKPCGKLGHCTDLWNTFRCRCEEGITGSLCNEVLLPMTLGGDVRIDLKLTSSYKRALELFESGVQMPSRRRRSLHDTSSTSVSIKFRTRQSNGVLMVSEDIGGNRTILELRNGKLLYSFNLGVLGSGMSSVSQPSLNDGAWHNVTVAVQSHAVFLTVDGSHTTSSSFTVPTHNFFTSETDLITFAGARPSVSSTRALTSFSGCFDGVTLNREKVSLQQSSQQFAVIIHGTTRRGCDGSNVCASNPCTSLSKPYCVDEWGAFRCSDPGMCRTEPCKHRGKCIPTEKGFKCNCLFNFTGENCETPIACLLRPCANSQRCIAGKESYQCVALIAGAKSGELETGIVVTLVVLAAVIFAVFVGCMAAFRRRELRKLNTIDKDGKGQNVFENKSCEKYFENEPEHEVVNADHMYHQLSEQDGIILVNEFANDRRLVHTKDTIRRENILRRNPADETMEIRNMHDLGRHEMKLLSRRHPKDISRSQPLGNGHVQYVDEDQRVSKLSLPLRFSDEGRNSRLQLTETRLINPNISVRYPGTTFEDTEFQGSIDAVPVSQNGGRRRNGGSNLERSAAFESLQAIDSIGVRLTDRQKVRSADIYPSMIGHMRRDNAKSLPATLNSRELEHIDMEMLRIPRISDSPYAYMESGFESTGSDTNYSDDADAYRGHPMDDSSSQLEHYDLEVASMGFSEMSWQCDSSIDMRENTVNDIDNLVRTMTPRFLDIVSRSSNDRGPSDICDRFSDCEPADSSSDSDDSFTCSEMDYNEERLVHQRRRKQMIFSRIAEGSETERFRSMSHLSPRIDRDWWMHGDSASDTSLSHGRTSTSSNELMPMARFGFHGGRGRGKRSKGTPRGYNGGQTLDWDELLNWGMKYENIREVYNFLGFFKFDSSSNGQAEESNVPSLRERQPRMMRHMDLSFPSIRLADVPESEVEEYV